jgi:phage-related protein
VKPLKLVAWLGDSRERVRFFPSLARREIGLELQAVQEGKDPSDWKPMPIVGAGVKEMRVHTDGEYRVLYVAKFESYVYVLHAFVKKSRTTSRAAIDLARSRYGEVLRREGQSG